MTETIGNADLAGDEAPPAVERKRSLMTRSTRYGRVDILEGKPYYYDVIGIGVAAKCNLRCVYCHQSLPDFDPGPDLDDRTFEHAVEFCKQGQDTYVELTGRGDTIVVAGWHEKVRKLIDAGLRVQMTTNLSKQLSPEEVDVLSRYTNLCVSIDSADRKTLARIRRKADVRIITYNLMLIRAAALQRQQQPPNFLFGTVLNDVSIFELCSLVSFAAACGVNVIQFGDLHEWTDLPKDIAVGHVTNLKGEAFRRAYKELLDAIELSKKLGVEARIQPNLLELYSAAATNIGSNEPVAESESAEASESTAVVSSQLDDQTFEFPEFGAAKLRRQGLQVPEGKTRLCYDPWTFLHINSQGSVRPCCFYTEVLGDIRHTNTTLDELINGDMIREIRRGLFTGELGTECQTCKFKKIVDVDAFQAELAEYLGRKERTHVDSLTSAGIDAVRTWPRKADSLFVAAHTDGGQALSSGGGFGSPERAFDGQSDTFWVSPERGPNVRDNAWLGFAFPAQQWIGRLVLTQTNNAGFRQDLVEVQYRDGDDEEWASAVIARIPIDENKSFIDLREPVRARQWRVLARADNAVDETHAWTPLSLEFFSPVGQSRNGS